MHTFDVPTLVHNPYAILAHSAGALAAARFMTRTPPLTSALMPIVFVADGGSFLRDR